MSWVILFFAGVLEVAWAVGLKQSAGFTRLWPSVFTAVTMAGSVGAAGPGAAPFAARYRLRGVDRHRHRRHRRSSA